MTHFSRSDQESRAAEAFKVFLQSIFVREHPVSRICAPVASLGLSRCGGWLPGTRDPNHADQHLLRSLRQTQASEQILLLVECVTHIFVCGMLLDQRHGKLIELSAPDSGSICRHPLNSMKVDFAFAASDRTGTSAMKGAIRFPTRARFALPLRETEPTIEKNLTPSTHGKKRSFDEVLRFTQDSVACITNY